MTAKRICICGKQGPDGLHPINSMACPVHGEKRPMNPHAYAIGTERKGGFLVRRIVWGRLAARAELRQGEKIRRAVIYVKPE